MIGRKKLSDIRQDLRRALAPAGGDPIRWLEERLTAPDRQGPAATRESEVLHSLKRFLEVPDRPKRRKQRAK